MRSSRILLVSSFTALTACAHALPVVAAPAAVAARSPIASTIALGTPTLAEVPCAPMRVFFTTGSSALDASSTDRLDVYASCVIEQHRGVLYITGTTDPSGALSDNASLAQARGRVVADYLHAAGCHMAFEIRSYPADAPASRRLWPWQRITTVSSTPPRH
jgi:outer membrane protein OmpA-like peptidoglycan-associated protein